MVNPRPIVIVVTSTMLWAQDAVLEQITSDALSTPDLDRIEFYSDNPLLLDSARVEDILQLPLLSRTTARRIVSILRTKKPQTIAALCDAVGCSEEERYVLGRCAKLGGSSRAKVPLSVRSRAMLWATPPSAATDGRFRGSPHELYTRAHMVAGNTAVAALANKDAGEPLVADFLSASIATRLDNIGIIIGDYYAEMGLGLVLWRPFGARKGTDVVTPCTEFGRGFQQYRSALEYRFFRGVAVEYPLAVADGTTILVRAGLSALPRSASLDTVGGVITSLATDGYHRSSTEIARRRNVTERAALGALELRTSQFVCGIAALMLDYPMPVTSSSTLAMPARRGLFASAYALQNTDNTTWTAELARDYAGNVATRAGLEFRTTPATIALGGRWYAPMFRAPYGYNFGESSQPTNEAGIYLGVRARLATGLENLFYADVYRHTAPIGTLPRLRRGVDVFNETRVRLRRGASLLVRLRQEHRTEDRSTDAGSVAEEILRSTLRCELQHSDDAGVTARFRIEGVWQIPTESTVSTPEHGLAAFGELSIPLSAQLSIGGRLTAYSTASFNSAVYTFEQLAPGLLVSVPLYGRGTRWFVYLRCVATEHITFWVRYGATERLNVASLGSGLTEVPGTHEGRAYIQLDVRL
jgi:hypothetical protein